MVVESTCLVVIWSSPVDPRRSLAPKKMTGAGKKLARCLLGLIRWAARALGRALFLFISFGLRPVSLIHFIFAAAGLRPSSCLIIFFLFLYSFNLFVLLINYIISENYFN